MIREESVDVRARGLRRNETIGLAIVGISAVLLYWHTFGYFWKAWRTDTQYSMAYLVPFVSGYFIRRQWPLVIKTKRAPHVAGLCMVVLAIIMHLGGEILDISGPSSLSVLLFLIGLCIYLHSLDLVRVLWFPIAYLIFAIPFPGGVTDMIGFPLQLWASGATATLLHTVGIEVTRNGVNMSLPGFEFQVAEACSGMSSLVALVGVTAVFAYITSLPNKLKWLLFFLAVPVALAANVVRITTIALVGYQWGQHAAMDIYHDWSSPLLFIVAILLLFLINGGMEWLTSRRGTQ